MSEPIHLTFVSDTMDEFPKNTNASFKVRLPKKMTLKGEGSYASLWKLTVPDDSQSNNVIHSNSDLPVLKLELQLIRFYNKDANGKYTQAANNVKPTKSVKLKHIMNGEKPVYSGVQFWKNSMDVLFDSFMYQLQYDKDSRMIADHMEVIPEEWLPSVK